MSLKLGTKAPDFHADSTQGPIRFYEWAGDAWVVFFSHPADFTPVCTTELGLAARLEPEFHARRAKLLAISVDDLASHHSWMRDIEQTQGASVGYPIVADPEQLVAEAYRMVHEELDPKLTVRTVFFIDPAKRIRATITYPASVGRSIDEILRVLDGLMLTDAHPVATPVNWRRGDDVLINPSLTDPEQIAARFPRGYREVTPYLRITPQPTDD